MSRSKTRVVDPAAPSSEALLETARLIARGGVVAYPTETFYGLAASAFDAGGCGRIFSIKRRPGSRALPCVISGIHQLDLLSPVNAPVVLRLAAAFWPGPLTLVVSAREEVAAASEKGTVAVRVSGHPVARALAEASGPVTSTSANRSGAREATTAAEVEAELGDLVDLVLDAGSTDGGLASTIVDVTKSVPELVREGPVSFREVLEALGSA